MTSEIRANTLKNRVGLGTIEYSNTGPVISGVTTASNFKTGSSNLHSSGVEVAGVNVLGADTPIGLGATIYNSGAAVFTGVVTATSFSGSGDLDVDGHTNLDNVSVAGVSTFTGQLNAGVVELNSTINVIGESTFRDRIQLVDSAPEILLSVPSGGLDSRILNDGSGNLIIGHGINSDTPTERLRIASDGKVGIGTNSPQKLLELQHVANRKLQFSYDDNIITIKGANNNGNPETIRLIGGNSIIFHTGATGSGTEQVRITSAGVQIDTPGVTAGNGASAKLQVDSSSQYDGLLLGNAATYGTISRGANNGALVYTANAYPANLGGGDPVTHEWWSGSAGGGGPNKLMVLTAGGNTGINVSSPDTKLHIKDGMLKIQTETTFYNGSGENGENYPSIFLNANHTIGNNPAHAKITVRHSSQNPYSGDIILMPRGYYGGSYGYQDVLRVSAYKRVGINESSPDRELHISNDTTGGIIRLTNTDTTISDGTICGMIEFEQRDSNTPGVSANIRAEMEDTTNGANSLNFSTGTPSTIGTRMIIQANGRVNIGGGNNGSALAALHINTPSAVGTDTAFWIGANGDNRYMSISQNASSEQFSHMVLRYDDNGTRNVLQLRNSYSTGTGYGTQVQFKGHNNEQTGSIKCQNITSGSSNADMSFTVNNSDKEVLRLHSGGDGRFYNGLTIAKIDNDNSNFTKSGLVLSTPAYAEYQYTWSGQSSYTIDLTCGSYFHSEFIYIQHQTNGGTGMHHYVRGKWSNNHETHTCMIHEYSGDGAGLDVTFVASDQSGNGAVNGEDGLTAAGWSNANYRGLYGGGGDRYDNTSSANGRLRITETYNWGSVSTRMLILRVFFGSHNISKS